MSVRVSVKTDPVTINRSKILLVDVEQAKKKEFERRRKLRLQQVRQQSRDIAGKVRKKVSVELKAIEKEEEEKRQQEKEDWKKKQLEHLKQEFDKCLQSVGSAHQSASLQPDAKLILKEQKNVMQAVARARGSLAEEKAKKEKHAIKDKENKIAEQLEYARKVEKLRSTMVSRLPPAVERFSKPSKPSEKSVKKTISKSSKKKQTKNAVTSPVHSPRKPLKDVQTCTELKSPNHKMTSPLKFQVCRERNRSLTIPDEEFSDDSDDSSATWPPRSQLSTRPSLHKVKLYNHNERKTTEYLKPTTSVNRIGDDFDMRMEIDKEKAERAELEMTNKMKLDKLDKRGKEAMQREKTEKEFDQMCSAISEINKQEKIQNVSAPPGSSFLKKPFHNQDRLQELLKDLQESPEKCPKLFDKQNSHERKAVDSLKELCDRFQKHREKLLHPNNLRNLSRLSESSDEENEIAGWMEANLHAKPSPKSPDIQPVAEKPPLPKKKRQVPQAEENQGRVLPHYDPRPAKIEERKGQSLITEKIHVEPQQPEASFREESPHETSQENESQYEKSSEHSPHLSERMSTSVKEVVLTQNQRCLAEIINQKQRSPCSLEQNFGTVLPKHKRVEDETTENDVSPRRQLFHDSTVSPRRSLPCGESFAPERSVRQSWPQEKEKSPSARVERISLDPDSTRSSSSGDNYRVSESEVENIFRGSFSTENSATPRESSGSDAVEVVVRISGKEKKPKVKKIVKKPVYESTPVNRVKEQSSSTSYYSPPTNLSPEQHSLLSNVLKKLVVKNKNSKLHDYIVELLNKTKSSVSELGVSSVSDITVQSDICNLSDISSVNKIKKSDKLSVKDISKSSDSTETTYTSSISDDVPQSDIINAFVRRIEKLTDIVDDCNVIFTHSSDEFKDESLSNYPLIKETVKEKKKTDKQYPAPEDSVLSNENYIEENKSQETSDGISIGVPSSLHPKPFLTQEEESSSSNEVPFMRKKEARPRPFELSTIQEVETPMSIKTKSINEKNKESSELSDLTNQLNRLHSFYEAEKEPNLENSVSSISESEFITDKDVCSILESSSDGIEEVFRSLGIGWALSTLRKTRERNKLSMESSSTSNEHERTASRSRSKNSTIKHSTPIKRGVKKLTDAKPASKELSVQTDSLTPPSVSLNHPFLKK
ncbi:trichohyalin-like [Cimex lectularius]|uniref:Uncharacterized protein n=1 Tax=Cimex lectularius TaxID=79782 RepID=A0A8I6S194_CIMLE|nr:trichohyalin-like [Cimex lectularius]